MNLQTAFLSSISFMNIQELKADKEAYNWARKDTILKARAFIEAGLGNPIALKLASGWCLAEEVIELPKPEVVKKVKVEASISDLSFSMSKGEYRAAVIGIVGKDFDPDKLERSIRWSLKHMRRHNNNQLCYNQNYAEITAKYYWEVSK